MPTTYLVALKIGGALAGSMGWYWSLPQLVRQATDARARDMIERTYRRPMRHLSFEQAQAVYDWARAQHA